MRTILIVDDSATMRRMVQASLRGLKDVRFAEADNGLEAIERLALESVNLIVTDLNMPDMHGLELVQFVRKHQTFRGVRIVVLTTRSDDSSRDTLLAAGASLYVTKPFRPDVLAGQVGDLLDREAGACHARL
jgi:two-component system, chemotaxis family, chemotaxis protein CheY